MAGPGRISQPIAAEPALIRWQGPSLAGPNPPGTADLRRQDSAGRATPAQPRFHQGWGLKTTALCNILGWLPPRTGAPFLGGNRWRGAHLWTPQLQRSCRSAVVMDDPAQQSAAKSRALLSLLGGRDCLDVELRPQSFRPIWRRQPMGPARAARTARQPGHLPWQGARHGPPLSRRPRDEPGGG